MTGTRSGEDRPPGDVSLFERLGGTGPLRAAIDDFYRAVLADPALAPYFDGVDVDRITLHQVALFTELLGGPGSYGRQAGYGGQGLWVAHQPLHIPVEHYQLVVGHLVATLVGLGIPDDVFAAIGQAANAVQPEIVYDPEGGSTLSSVSHTRS